MLYSAMVCNLENWLSVDQEREPGEGFVRGVELVPVEDIDWFRPAGFQPRRVRDEFSSD